MGRVRYHLSALKALSQMQPDFDVNIWQLFLPLKGTVPHLQVSEYNVKILMLRIKHVLFKISSCKSL
jgi:hypothetical protein